MSEQLAMILMFISSVPMGLGSLWTVPEPASGISAISFVCLAHLAVCLCVVLTGSMWLLVPQTAPSLYGTLLITSARGRSAKSIGMPCVAPGPYCRKD